MFSAKFICLFLLFGTGTYGDFDGPVVETLNGLVRGTVQTSRKGQIYNSFEGIPFAKPPIGKLRFREPEPAKPWTGIWQANNHYQCMQFNHDPRHFGKAEGDEDCLYLNVYSPIKNDGNLRDVLVHIHGGAFMFGHADLYGPKHLMDKEIVFVNFNYRLGPLGFLSTEDEVVPGNNGMKDQVLALQWIKDNIRYFGGDPNSITITGLSAGGASVHYHYLSPLSKDLFHKGISASGTAICNWALVEEPLAKARRLGSLVGCDQIPTKELVACLRRRSGKQITETVKYFQPWLYNPYTPFGPVVEKQGTNPFLPDNPFSLLEAGLVQDLPWLTSITSEEGLYPAAEFLYKSEYLAYLENNWVELAPHILHFNDTVPLEEQKNVAMQIKEYYLQGRKISRDSYNDLVQMIGDRLFVVDAEKSARLQAKINKSPVYFYKFAYRGDFSVSEYLSHSDENVGVCHADDIMHIVSADKSWFKKYLISDADNKMCDLLLDIWSNFAKTGTAEVPKSKWTTVSQNTDKQFHYLHIISPELQQMDSADFMGHRPFWDSLPFQENHKVIKRDEL